MKLTAECVGPQGTKLISDLDILQEVTSPEFDPELKA